MLFQLKLAGLDVSPPGVELLDLEHVEPPHPLKLRVRGVDLLPLVDQLHLPIGGRLDLSLQVFVLAERAEPVVKIRKFIIRRFHVVSVSVSDGPCLLII